MENPYTLSGDKIVKLIANILNKTNRKQSEPCVITIEYFSVSCQHIYS